jgi:protein-tyrosine phosphatase
MSTSNASSQPRWRVTETVAAPGARIEIASVPNLRDVGGWPTRGGGTVRRGVLYRSIELSHLHGDDLTAFAKLGIRTVYDLRTAAEQKAQPDHVPDGTEDVALDVLADSKDAAPAALIHVLDDPKAAAAMLGEGRAVTLFENAYRELVNLPSALTAYRALFTQLGDEAHRPALIHCTTGKDRTGWATAALLTLVGVDDELVLKEYLLTNEQLVPALEPILVRFEEAGGDRSLLLPIVGVQQEYLESSFAEMKDRFGTIERYFADGLGIDDGAQRRLRDVFTDA